MANLYVQYNGLVMGSSEDPDQLCGTCIDKDNNIVAWDGLGYASPTPHVCCPIPTPYVTREDKYEYIGEKSHRITSLTLSGSIYPPSFLVDDGGSPSNLYDQEYLGIDYLRTSILNAFSEDFLTLTAGNYTFPYVVVKGIDFDDGNTGIISYTITLESYDEFFRDSGVTNPKNEYTISENEDGTVEVRHVISAKGIRSSVGGDPVALARAFCDTYNLLSNSTTKRKMPSTAFIKDAAGNALNTQSFLSVLQTFGPGLAASEEIRFRPFSVSETSNRIEGTYTIEEVYKTNNWATDANLGQRDTKVASVDGSDTWTNSGAGIDYEGFTVSFDINNQIDLDSPFETVQMNWSIRGGDASPLEEAGEISDVITALRNKIPSVRWFSDQARRTYLIDLDNDGDVDTEDMVNSWNMTSYGFNVEPTSYDVTENVNENKIDVSISFDTLYAKGYTGVRALLGTGAIKDEDDENIYTYSSIPSFYDDGDPTDADDFSTLVRTPGFAWLDYSVSIDQDEVTEITSIAVEGTMKARGSSDIRKARVQKWFNTLLAEDVGPQYVGLDNTNWGGYGGVEHYLYGLAIIEYQSVISSKRDTNDGTPIAGTTNSDRLISDSNIWPLHPAATDVRVTDSGSEIKISATFNNRDLYIYRNADSTQPEIIELLARSAQNSPTLFDNWIFKNISFNIKADPAMYMYSSKAGINTSDDIPADYLVFDHNTLSKESLSIQVNGCSYLWGGISNPLEAGGGYRLSVVSTWLDHWASEMTIRLADNFMTPAAETVFGMAGRAIDSQDGTKAVRGYNTNQMCVDRNTTLSQTVAKPFLPKVEIKI